MSKQQLGNAFVKFVGWKAVILKTSTKAATPSDIMMTAVSGAVSILEKGIRRGHTVSLSVGEIRESKKPNIVVKCVQMSINMINVGLK